MFLVRRILAWHPDDETNVWEQSGLYEGDIMIYHSSHMDKNGLIDKATRWPNGTVPYHISDTFCKWKFEKKIVQHFLFNMQWLAHSLTKLFFFCVKIKSQ